MKQNWLRNLEMSLRTSNDGSGSPQRMVLELCLILVVLGITVALCQAPGYELAILNLYFLPVTLGGFFLGRYRAGVLTLLCILCVVMAHLRVIPEEDGIYLMRSVTIALWGGVLGLAAILVGTLSDERSRELAQLHASHKSDTLCDALTGLANRRAFDYELNRRSVDWSHRQVNYSLLLVDVDLFKKFNDTYGHRAGDAILRGVAQQLKMSVRDTDLVARYGGEELAIILPDATPDKLMEAGERIRHAVEIFRFTFEGLTLRLTVSVGAARVLSDESATSLIERADVALYASKQAGRNCAHYHDGTTCRHFGAAATNILDYENPNKEELVVKTDDAYADRLTGLPSRKVFVEELRRRLAETRRYDAPLSLMLVRLDGSEELKTEDEAAYKKAVLVVGEAIQNMMRDSDLVAQFDEDQFAVLMPSTSVSRAIIPSERLRRTVAEFRGLRKSGTRFNVTVSIGLTGYLQNDATASILSRTANALDAAHERGGNFACFDDGSGCAPSSFTEKSHKTSSESGLSPEFIEQVEGDTTDF